MSRIMRLPRGLLSMFDSKSTGANPPDYVDELRLVADMYQHYLPPQEFISDATGSPTAVAADIGDIQVPNGEMWVVRASGFRVSGVSASGTVTVANIMLLAGSSVSISLPEQVHASSLGGTAAVFRRVHFFSPLLIAEPGTIFRTRVDDTTVNINVSNQLLFHRLTL